MGNVNTSEASAVAELIIEAFLFGKQCGIKEGKAHSEMTKREIEEELKRNEKNLELIKGELLKEIPHDYSSIIISAFHARRNLDT